MEFTKEEHTRKILDPFLFDDLSRVNGLITCFVQSPLSTMQVKVLNLCIFIML